MKNITLLFKHLTILFGLVTLSLLILTLFSLNDTTTVYIYAMLMVGSLWVTVMTLICFRKLLIYDRDRQSGDIEGTF